MAFPAQRARGRNARKLGRGQTPVAQGVSCVLSSTGTTNVTLTFSRPVVVTGTIPTTVATLTLVSQTIVSPTVVTQVWSGSVATHLATLPAGAANVATYQGGQVIGNQVTF
jgi:hypothetical protein